MQRMDEQFAWGVGVLWQRIVWPRIMYARSLHKLNRLKVIESRIRKIPWPHIKSYTSLIERLVTARTKRELRDDFFRAKEQVVRRVNRNSSNFVIFDERHLDVSPLPEPVGTVRQAAVAEIIRLFEIQDNAETVLMVRPLKWPPVIYERQDGA